MPRDHQKIALDRLNAFVAGPICEYGRLRNFDLGCGRHSHVSTLSRFIRNRTLSEEAVVSAVLELHAFRDVEKFIQEVFWRTYWKGWLEMRPGVWGAYTSRSFELLKGWEEDECYVKAVDGKTGIQYFDTWVQELKATGYLHNHARMWFASIWIFTFELPWELGARFFLKHLLDGDPASNTLSWRWVAGLQTIGKHYLATEENIAKFTRGRFMASSRLNEVAEPIALSEPIPEIQPLPPITQGALPNEKRMGWLMTDEDVGGISEFALEPISIIGVLPQTEYRKHGVADEVIHFRKECLRSGIERLASDCGLEKKGIVGDCLEDICGWVKAENLNAVGMLRPAVGFWSSLLPELEKALQKERITLYYLRREWDSELYPHGTHGFFRFKEVIPEFLCAKGYGKI